MKGTSDHFRKPLRVIGIGNPLAGDDAVGIYVAKKLMKLELPGVDVLTAGQGPLDILDYLEGAEAAILIDAIQSGKEIGAVERLEIPRDLGHVNAFTSVFRAPSTHQFGLGEALCLGSELKTLPSYLIIYGIELGHTQMGECLSPRIAESIETVVNRIVEDINQLTSEKFK